MSEKRRPRKNADWLNKAIRTTRKHGTVVVHVCARSPIVPDGLTSQLDEYVMSRGFRGIGDNWIELEAGIAWDRLVHMIRYDLAHGDATMDEERAWDLTERFLAFFSSSARFFTNAEPWEVSETGSRLRCSAPLTDATLEEAFVGIDDTRIGIVLMSAEH